MGRELRWHLARAGREKLKGLGKTRAPSADRGNPGPLESQLSGRDPICAKTFKTSCAPAIWSARSPSQGWSNGWFPTGFKLKRWSWRRETRPRVPIRQSSSRIDSAEAWNRAINVVEGSKGSSRLRPTGPLVNCGRGAICMAALIRLDGDYEDPARVSLLQPGREEVVQGSWLPTCPIGETP